MPVIADLAELKQGWRILLLSVMGIAISINAVLLYGFGTLVVSFEKDFAWERSAIQIAITFLYGGAVIGLQLVGWLNLRFGLKTVTLVSLLTMAIGYLACVCVLRFAICKQFGIFRSRNIMAFESLQL